MDYDDLERNIRAWCRAEAGIRAAIVVGSRAGGERVDAWSDLDIVVFADRPEAFAAEAGWMGQLGPVWLAVLDTTGANEPEWLALFEGGLKVDLVFTPASGAAGLAGMMQAAPYRNVFRRGVRVLYDAGPAGAQAGQIITGSAPAEAGPPTAEAFEQAIAGTLMAVNKAARLLARGELWRAQQHINCVLKTRLLTMITWRAKATARGPEPDTGYAGRHLEAWADAETVAALPGTVGAYEAKALRTALARTLDLYCRLGRETAEALGLAYPAAAEANLRAWLQEI